MSAPGGDDQSQWTDALYALPPAAYIAAAMLLYLLAIGLLMFIRYLLMLRGVVRPSASDDALTSKGGCGSACLSCCGTLLPCTECSGRSLLNRVCPKEKRLDCARCITCECLRPVAFGGQGCSASMSAGGGAAANGHGPDSIYVSAAEMRAFRMQPTADSVTCPYCGNVPSDNQDPYLLLAHVLTNHPRCYISDVFANYRRSYRLGELVGGANCPTATDLSVPGASGTTAQLPSATASGPVEQQNSVVAPCDDDSIRAEDTLENAPNAETIPEKETAAEKTPSTVDISQPEARPGVGRKRKLNDVSCDYPLIQSDQLNACATTSDQFTHVNSSTQNQAESTQSSATTGSRTRGYKKTSRMRVNGYYECSECQFRTKHSTSMQSHEMGHQRDPASMPYRCDKCNFCTTTRLGLCHHAKSSHPVDRNQPQGERQSVGREVPDYTTATLPSDSNKSDQIQSIYEESVLKKELAPCEEGGGLVLDEGGHEIDTATSQGQPHQDGSTPIDQEFLSPAGDTWLPFTCHDGRFSPISSDDDQTTDAAPDKNTSAIFPALDFSTTDAPDQQRQQPAQIDQPAAHDVPNVTGPAASTGDPAAVARSTCAAQPVQPVAPAGTPAMPGSSGSSCTPYLPPRASFPSTNVLQTTANPLPGIGSLVQPNTFTGAVRITTVRELRMGGAPPLQHGNFDNERYQWFYEYYMRQMHMMHDARFAHPSSSAATNFAPGIALPPNSLIAGWPRPCNNMQPQYAPRPVQMGPWMPRMRTKMRELVAQEPVRNTVQQQYAAEQQGNEVQTNLRQQLNAQQQQQSMPQNMTLQQNSGQTQHFQQAQSAAQQQAAAQQQNLRWQQNAPQNGAQLQHVPQQEHTAPQQHSTQ